MPKPNFQEFYSVAKKNGAPDMNSARDLYLDTFGDDASVWAGPTRDEFRDVGKQNANRFGDVYNEEELDKLYDENYNEDTLSSMRRGFMRGGGMVTTAFGTNIEQAGMPYLGDRIVGAGERLSETYPQSPWGRSVDFENDFWGSMANSDYWTGTIPEQIPVMAPPYIGAAVGGPLGYLMGTALGADIEATQVYRDAKKMGWSDDMSNEAFWKTFGMDASMQAATGGLSKLAAPLGAPVKAGITGSLEATTEMAEEGVAEMNLGGDFLEGMRKGINVGPVAFMMGAGGSLVDSYQGREVAEVPPPPPAIEPAPQTAEDIIKGNWDKAKMVYDPTQPETIDPVQPPPPAPVQAQQEAEAGAQPTDRLSRKAIAKSAQEDMLWEQQEADRAQQADVRTGIAQNLTGIQAERDITKRPATSMEIAMGKAADIRVEQAVEQYKSSGSKGITGYNIPNELINDLKIAAPEASAFVSQKGTVITLDEIQIPKELRRKGLGSKFMDTLTSYADNNGLDIVLTAAGDYGGSKAGQQRFYKRHEFKMNKGRNKDYRYTENMIRRAQGLPETLKRQSGLADQDIIQTDKIPEMLKPQSGVKQATEAYKISDLKGKNISYDVFAEDTRETFTVTEDAGKVMQKLYARLKSLKQLRVCVS